MDAAGSPSERTAAGQRPAGRVRGGRHHRPQARQGRGVRVPRARSGVPGPDRPGHPAHGVELGRRPSRTGPEPSGQYRAAQVPSRDCIRRRNSRIRSACAECPVAARAAATQLESRGQAYAQPRDQPASTAPSGRVSRRRSSRAWVAMDRCAALTPGMIPEASQARLAATAAAAQAGPPAPAPLARSTLLPGTNRAREPGRHGGEVLRGAGTLGEALAQQGRDRRAGPGGSQAGLGGQHQGGGGRDDHRGPHGSTLRHDATGPFPGRSPGAPRPGSMAGWTAGSGTGQMASSGS